jgi:hypothetical protein
MAILATFAIASMEILTGLRRKERCASEEILLMGLTWERSRRCSHAVTVSFVSPVKTDHFSKPATHDFKTGHGGGTRPALGAS